MVFSLSANASAMTTDVTDEITPIKIIKSEGWLESLCVYWEATPNTDGYDVFVKKSTAKDYPETAANAGIHAPLVSKQAGSWRFDAVGLEKGRYDVKVLPRGESDEYAGYATGIEVLAYDRSGFAFSPNSLLKGTPPGAYKADGTLKDNAEVVYVTRDDVSALKRLEEDARFDTSRPLSIRIVGHFPRTFMVDVKNIKLNNNQMLLMRAEQSSETKPQYITIEGIGSDATLGTGINVNRIVGVEVRNLGFVYHFEDAAGVERAQNIWVHNNEFFYGEEDVDEPEGDKQKGDGSSDAVRTKYLTISYNRYWDTGKTTLLDGGRYVDPAEHSDFATYHHNFFNHADSRHPRIRHANVHVYNNYYKGIPNYGIGAAHNTKGVFAEGNYFENTNRPMTISMQGSDAGTFSRESGGIIKSFNNLFENCTNVRPYHPATNPVEFDYVDVTSGANSVFTAAWKSGRNSIIPNTIKTKYINPAHEEADSKIMTYSNFDTDKSILDPKWYYCGNVGIYNSTANVVQNPREAKARVLQFAGRMLGGDLTYEFDCDVNNDGVCTPACKDAPRRDDPMPEMLKWVESASVAQAAVNNQTDKTKPLTFVNLDILTVGAAKIIAEIEVKTP